MSDIKQGDTVRLHGDEYEVVAVGVEKAFLRTREGGEFSAYLSGLVKVEPTPADRYLVIDVDGAVRWGSAYESASHAAAVARESGRVARYAFAGWVDTEAVES